MSARELVRLSLDDLDGVLRRRGASFGEDPADPVAAAAQERCLRAGQLWGLAEDGAVVGHCRRRRVAHWFGGRPVPVQQIGGVAVPPEHRGRGVATDLMSALVRHDADAGAGLSLLFPATTPLYRRLGWEHSGWLQTYRLEARAVGRTPGPGLRPAERDGDWDAVRACYDAWAPTTSGAVDREEQDWEALASVRWRYLLDGEDGVPQAYALVDHDRPPGDWQYVLRIRDWVARTDDGLRALVAFVGAHGSFAKAATFRGPVPNPWVLHVPEQDVQRVAGMHWMARPVDLVAAVTARGYPPGVRTELVVALADPVLPAAPRTWSLSVADGRAALQPGPRGADVELDVRGAGPLLTGFLDPWSLRTAGLLRGSDRAVAALAAPFAGPSPSLRDFF